MVTLTRGTLAVGILALASSVAPAQHAAPPISGVTGTVAIEGVVEKEYAAANVVIVKTLDGMEHAFHFAKGLFVHGREGEDATAALQEGAMVAVHYSVQNGREFAEEIDRLDAGGLLVTEGRLAHIDRARQEITLLFANGKTETFRLTHLAAAEAANDVAAAGDTETIVLYYANESGQKVAHYFRKAR